MPKENTDDKHGAGLFDLLNLSKFKDEEDSEKPAAEGEEEANTEVEQPNPEPDAGAEPDQKPVEEKVVEAGFDDGPDLEAEMDKLRKQLERIQKRDSEPAAPKASDPVPPAVEAADPFEGLDDDQADELATFQKMEELDPEKYKNLSKLAGDYFRKLNEYKEKQDSSWDPEYDDRFQKDILGKKPIVNKRDYKQAEVSRYAEPMLSKREAQLKKEIDEYKRKLKELETKPTLESSLKKYTEAFPKFGEDSDPIEKSIATEYMESAKPFAEEYVKLYTGVVDPDPKNETHKAINQFVADRVHYFENRAPKEKKYRDGKMFVSPTDYANLVKTGEHGNYWTFSPSDVVQMMGAHVASQAKAATEARYKELEKSGWARVKRDKGASEKKADAEQDKGEAPPVKGGTTPVPGSSRQPKEGIPNMPFLSQLISDATSGSSK